MTRLRISRPLILSITAAALVPLNGEVKVNPLFTDGAVLQRGQSLPVWGTAGDGEKVTVEFAGQKASTMAAGGKWSVSLPPVKEGGPHTMTITGDNELSVKDILIGDVWLCSGQSNMHFQMKSVGGTRIESWMGAGTLAATGESSALVEKWKKISPEEFEKIGAAYSSFQHLRDHVHPDAVRAAKAKGQPAPPAPVAPKLRCHDRPSALHNGMIAKGETLTGFTIAGDDGKFHPGTAAIKGKKIIVTSAKVSQPKAVRYNWAMMPEGNLFNREGLPAAPFRSDEPAATDR